MKLPRIFVTQVALGLLASRMYSADPGLPALKPPGSGPTNTLVWNPTNTLVQLPPYDRLWLIGEQLKQLVGDWVNQQGDIGMDLMYYLQEPYRILAGELKRVESEHQKEIAGLQKDLAELRAELQALKQAQGMRTNATAAAIPAAPMVSTNKSEPRPSARAGGSP